MKNYDCGRQYPFKTYGNNWLYQRPKSNKTQQRLIKQFMFITSIIYI